MESELNTRARSRVVFERRVFLEGDKGLISATSKNISANGILVALDAPLPIGQRKYNILIKLSSAANVFSIEIKIAATLVRKSRTQAAFAFDQMDADSFNYLKEVLLANCGDNISVVQELESKLGFK